MGAELPCEGQWKESLMEGWCLVLNILKTGVFGEVLAVALLTFEVW